jgi:hypothetical protein
MGALTENHRCPRRRPLSRLGDPLLTVFGGAAVGTILCYGFEENPNALLVLAAAALGAVIASAIRQSIGPRF